VGQAQAQRRICREAAGRGGAVSSIGNSCGVLGRCSIAGAWPIAPPNSGNYGARRIDRVRAHGSAPLRDLGGGRLNHHVGVGIAARYDQCGVDTRAHCLLSGATLGGWWDVGRRTCVELVLRLSTLESCAARPPEAELFEGRTGPAGRRGAIREPTICCICPMRAAMFSTEDDYAAFERVLEEAFRREPCASWATA